MSGYLLWQDPAGNLQRAEIPEHALTVGSQAPCGLVIEHGDVGPVHAAVEREASGCRLRKLTRVRKLEVNGKTADEHRLSHGDKVTLGTFDVRFVSGFPVASRMLRLVMTRNEDETPLSFPLAGTITVLGRMEGDLLVEDPSVSSRHLEIENFGPGMRWVRDLGSTNGSELNGQPLGPERMPLTEGDVLSVGRVKIEVHDGGKPPDGLTTVVQRTVIFVPDQARA